MTKTLLVTPASRPCTNLRETAPDQTRARKAGRGDCRWWSGRVCAATTDPTPRERRRLAVEPLQTPACAPISTGNGGPRCRSTCSICKILKHRRWQGTRGLSCASGSNPTDDTRGRWAGLVEFGRSSIRAPTARLRRLSPFRAHLWAPPKWARVAVIDGWQSSINPDRCHPTLHRMRVASRRWAGPGFPERSSEDCRQSPHHSRSILW
jgi:hypothetical protein